MPQPKTIRTKTKPPTLSLALGVPILPSPKLAIPDSAVKAVSANPRTKQLLAFAMVLRSIDPEMPAQQLQILFEVADKPGISANELKQRLGVAQSSISRGLKALGWGDERVPGKYLIENRPCPDDSRRRLHFLTARGVVLMDYLNGL